LLLRLIALRLLLLEGRLAFTQQAILLGQLAIEMVEFFAELFLRASNRLPHTLQFLLVEFMS
jgi:hypothetical protein